MRIDYEGEVFYKGLNLYVHADYTWDYDERGNHILVVTKVKAYTDSDEELDITNDFKDYMSNFIQQEFEDAA